MQHIKGVIVLCMSLMMALNASAMTSHDHSEENIKLRVKEINKVLKNEPGNVKAYAERASLKSKLGDSYGAIKDYSVALVLSPTTVSYQVARGNAFLEIGAFKEAMQDFEQAVSSEASTEALYGMAVVKYYLNDYFGAIRELDKVITAEPKHSKALYNRAVARIELNQLEEAVKDLNTFLVYHPGHKEALYALKVATTYQEKRTARL